MISKESSISICIVNWNTREDIHRLLDSLTACKTPVQVVICDNASKDYSSDMISRLFPEATLISSDRNLGFARGNNLCFEKAHGQYILIANPDIVLTDETLEEMRRPFAIDTRIGAIGAKLLNEDGSAQKNMSRKAPSLIQVLLYDTILKAFFLKWGWLRYKLWEDNTEANEISPVHQPAGACLMIRRDVLEKVGYFENRFELFYEDVDLCRRIRKAGYIIVFNPKAAVVHRGSTSLEREKPLRIKQLYYQSGALYFKIHHGLIQSLIYKIIFTLNEIAKIALRSVSLPFLPARRPVLASNIIDSTVFLGFALSCKKIKVDTQP
jgi:GT2 family glycosyltransferase